MIGLVRRRRRGGRGGRVRRSSPGGNPSMRAIRTVSAWTSLRRPTKSPRTWPASARMSGRRFWTSARNACRNPRMSARIVVRRLRISARNYSRRPWISARISARRARKSRRISYQCATISAARLAPTAKVAMRSADRVDSVVSVCDLAARVNQTVEPAVGPKTLVDTKCGSD